MPRNEFSVSVLIKCTPERAFDYLADHRHVAQVLEGVRRWEPITPKATGVGARFRVEIVAVGVPLPATLRLDRWSRPHVIGWVSESGPIPNEGSFTFTRAPAGVKLTLRLVYQPPAAAIGAAIARRADLLVRRRHLRALENVKKLLEAENP